MNNNWRSEGYGMQKSKDDLSRILAKSTTIFAQS
jgi:hypothetical protein